MKFHFQMLTDCKKARKEINSYSREHLSHKAEVKGALSRISTDFPTVKI